MTTRTVAGAVVVLVWGSTSALAEPSPATPAVAAPAALAVGAEGNFKPGVLLQAWYAYSDPGVATSTFRVRRAELSAKGEVVPKRFAYALMFDVARLLEFQDAKLAVSPSTPAATVTAKQPNGASSILQDLFITAKTALADVSLGQFRIPVGYESYNSSSKLLFHERALVSSRLADRRDIGLRVAKQWSKVGYSLGLFNGSGINLRDNDRGKDGALRLEVFPVEGLLVAGVIYRTLWQRDVAGAKERYEADLRYERGPLLFQGEYIYGRDVNKDASKTRGHGFYTALAGRIVPEVQLAGRVGYLNPDKAKLDDHTWAYEGILNYYLRGQEARIALAYSFFKSPAPARPSQHDVVLATQVSY